MFAAFFPTRFFLALFEQNLGCFFFAPSANVISGRKIIRKIIARTFIKILQIGLELHLFYGFGVSKKA